MTPVDRGLTAPMVDHVFQLMADWRRRAICLHFTTIDDDTEDVDDLVAAVQSRGEALSVDPEETRASAVRTALVEEHLPELDGAGVIDFDERSECVRYWGHATVEKWAEHAAAVTTGRH